MRIAIETQWYDPEGSSAALPGVIARAMQGRDHQVDVLTGFPDYPGGKVFPGHRVAPYYREVLRGVTVHRAPLCASHDRRALNYLNFGVGAAAVALTRLPSPDAILVLGTRATAAIATLAPQATRITACVFHVQDLWPHDLTNSLFRCPVTDHLERTLQSDTAEVTTMGERRRTSHCDNGGNKRDSRVISSPPRPCRINGVLLT